MSHAFLLIILSLIFLCKAINDFKRAKAYQKLTDLSTEERFIYIMFSAENSTCKPCPRKLG